PGRRARSATALAVVERDQAWLPRRHQDLGEDMSAPPEVRRAREDERTSVSAVLTDAFPDEPALNWWLKQGAEKDRARRKFFDAAVRDAVHPARQLWIAEDEADAPLGAAIWLPPGAVAFDLTPWKQLMVMPLLLSVAGTKGLD